MNRHYLRESDWDDGVADDSTAVVDESPRDYYIDPVAPEELEILREPVPRVVLVVMLIMLVPYVAGIWWLLSLLWDALRALALLLYDVARLFFV